jgi:hypothetical protein
MVVEKTAGKRPDLLNLTDAGHGIKGEILAEPPLSATSACPV